MVSDITLARFIRATTGVRNWSGVVLLFLFSASRVVFTTAKLRVLICFEEFLLGRISVIYSALATILSLRLVHVVDLISNSVITWSRKTLGSLILRFSHFRLIHVVHRDLRLVLVITVGSTKLRAIDVFEIVLLCSCDRLILGSDIATDGFIVFEEL
jgi:hypothetical protein